MSDPGELSEARDERGAGLPATVRAALAATAARVFVGRAGPAYHTATWLALRADHAAARDAVRAEFDPDQHLGRRLMDEHGVFVVQSRAGSKAEYLTRPNLGRRLADDARVRVTAECPPGADFQVVIGDGLSVAAVAAQVPALLPLLKAGAEARGWRFGRPFAVRYCRVGVMNDVGDLLRPAVVALLIGERPGLAAPDSLSVYLGFRPRSGHTDADRNVISNVHAAGVRPAEAAARVLAYAAGLATAGRSGVGVTEALPPASGPRTVVLPASAPGLICSADEAEPLPHS